MRLTVADAEDAFEALLLGREALSGVRVQYGIPAEEPKEDQRLYLVGIENLTRTLAIQQGAMDERYTLPLVLECRTHGATTRRAARDRALAIIDEVEQALDASPELAGTVYRATLAAIPVLTVRPYDDGWLAQGTLNVAVEATV